MTTALASKVEQLEDKAETYERQQNLEAQLDKAEASLRQLNSALDSLDEEVENLLFKTAVLTNLFTDDSRPGGVDDALRQVESTLITDAGELIDRIGDERLDDYTEQVRQVKTRVRDVRTDTVENRLRKHQEDWESRLSSAEQIQTITGGTREAEQTIRAVREFLNQEIWDTSNDPTSLGGDWQGYEKALENKVAVEWDEYQAEHNLSDRTIDILKRLAQAETVRFDDLTSGVAEEILSVQELRTSIELDI